MQILVQNLLTHYQKKGEGVPMVLLHGWGTDSSSFATIISFLQEKYTVYALDLPGFGKTQIPLKAWFVDDYVNFVEAFLNKLRIKKAVFLGHSFGGRVLIKLVVRRPELLKKLILTGAAGIKPQENWRKSLFKTSAKVGKAVLSLPGLKSLQKKARLKLYQAAGAQDYMQAGELKQTFLNVIEEDLTSYLEQIKVTTFLIWGEDDKETPLEDGRKMKELIPQAGLEIIPQAGHYAFLDQPEAFKEVLLKIGVFAK